MVQNLVRLLKKYYNYFKLKISGELPNVHLNSNTAERQKLGDGNHVYVRPSFSDAMRIHEYSHNIYTSVDELMLLVLKAEPDVLLDLGANIGLSSLALANKFPSLQVICAVEAEKENYGVLKRNFSLWSNLTKHTTKLFEPINGIITNTASLGKKFNVSNLSGGVSASGTFDFMPAALDNEEYNSSSHEFSLETYTVKNLLSKYELRRKYAIVKIDIEGSEDLLFDDDCDWLDNTVFMTIEIHDCMGKPNSSFNLLKKLVEHNFAIVPREDVLFCYNRRIILN